jgi:thymidylate synthase
MSRHPEHQYLDLLRELLDAPPRATRNDTATRSVFGRQMRFDLSRGFPLLTTKKLPFSVIAKELLWFLSGSTSVRPLQEQGVRIWDEWADEFGELGPVYGSQWRSWPAARRKFFPMPHYGENISQERTVIEPIDQIANVLQGLRDDPHGRRHIVTAWNPADITDMALPPCHCLFQFYVGTDGRLSCQLYQRSADIFLGVPFNIASYALLTIMFAAALNRLPGEFIWSGGDTHLYGNHEAQARQQVLREPRPFPFVGCAHRTDMDSWKLGDFCMTGYEPWPHIPAEVSA